MDTRLKLYFLRHGAAVEADEWKGGDFDRPLTDDGRKRLAQEAKALRKLGLELDVIVTSPLVRAKQTAEIVADALKVRSVVDDPRVGSGFDLGSLEGIVRDHADASAIMLVGHEPTMSETIGGLVGSARLDLKKGGLACVELADPSSLHGTLLWLVPPKLL